MPSEPYPSYICLSSSLFYLGWAHLKELEVQWGTLNVLAIPV